jgi:hypothetical protein
MTIARRARVLLLFLAASCLHASPLEPGMKAVEQIRGRKFLRQVRNVTIDRSELEKHLREQMAKSTPYPLDDFPVILRALQLVDGDPKNLLPQLLKLYESQVLAFYDPHSHTYYSIKQLPNLPKQAAQLADPKTLEETVMVHELVHALQDQHFQLGEREKANMRDTDANLAYHAVLEGEAVLVMMAHMLGKMGVTLDDLVKDEASLAMISNAVQADQTIDPSTPKYFAESLKFPYFKGLDFVIAAYRRGGWKELDKVHANPPRSTREVLHPEEYFEKTFTARPFDATKPAGALAVEHMGEFHWRFLVGEENARGWVNDRAVVYRDGRVEISSTWESPERATAFANAYGAFLKKRGVEGNVRRDGANVSASYTAK